jgi:flagellar biosynthesis/type III secretory pathway chaperone
MKNMDHRNLVSALDRHISLHRELIEIENEKISRIVAQDWRGLERRVHRSTEVLRQIEENERHRMQILEEIGGKSGSTLPELADSMAAEYSEELYSRRHTLQSLLIELKILNHRCEELISSSLEVVEFTLSLFTGQGGGGKTYSGEGEERASRQDHPSLVFDVKA